MRINKNSFLFLILFLADRISKELVKAVFPLGKSVAIIPGKFHLTYIQNTGIAFGMGEGRNIFFLIVSTVILGLFFIFFRRAKEKPEKLALLLVITGAFGNIFDRIFYGAVIDFLDFRIWPIFNFADSFITIGAVVLFYTEILHKKKKEIA